jgi:polyhydroxybutyrate depolymerase
VSRREETRSPRDGRVTRDWGALISGALFIVALSGATACGGPIAEGKPDSGLPPVGGDDASPLVVDPGLRRDLTLEHGGLTRYFDLYVPPNLPRSAVPLVFVLHGGTGDKVTTRSQPTVGGRWLELADAEAFLLVFPNAVSASTGTSAPAGSFNWNDCRNDARDTATQADDVGFVSAMIDWLEGRYPIDSRRIYATGLSNGGMMSYRLAFELSHRLVAIGAVVANLPANSDCPRDRPAHPIAVLIMNGTADSWMPWGGGQIIGQRGLVKSALETRDFWRDVIAPGSPGAEMMFPDINREDESTVKRESFGPAAHGKELWFYTVEGGGHIIPSPHPASPLVERLLGKQNRDIDGVEEIWTFFKRHARKQ